MILPLIESKLSAALRVALPLEIKLSPASAAQGVIAGYGSTFGGTPDAHGDIVASGAFAKSLARQKAAGSLPAMLWSHDTSEVIGRWTSMTEDAKGLLVEGQLELGTQRGREALALLQGKAITGLSIGYLTPKGGRTYAADGTAILKEADLLEVSLVAIPANRAAQITSVKSLAHRSDLVDLLQAAGLPKGAAVKLAAGGWPALTDTSIEDTELKELADHVAMATAALRKG